MGGAGDVLLGQAHPESKFFTSSIQDPFQKRVAAIVDPLGAKRKAGTLTYADVTAGSDALESEIAAFEQISKTYEGLGSDQGLVVKQARKTLNPIIESWRATFQSDLSTLPPPPPQPGDEKAPPSETPPTTTTILGGETAEERARRSAAERKRRLGGSGRQSTILTGAGGVPDLPAANRSYKTIVGR